ncbi:hypothetical protein MVEN_01151100 [Mycena venus]|uniref:Uncharacterized protein n=1 Tax=Mycena venus TaxID=2733690 RepID=A0A8H7CVD1_9AGAR|nr:hypothetical protein MVEN_01151100 [Mycena venus]
MPGGGYRTIHNAVGDMINWYNVQVNPEPLSFRSSARTNSVLALPQFYSCEDTTCENLLDQSESYLSQSSLFEISADAQVPL